MPLEFNITDSEIVYAEKLLLRVDQHFDEERKNFIRNFNTIDLNSVPGSGKTTTLLAKLLILEQYLPLDNNCGVLVISHTNSAVDEIKTKLWQQCPKIFTYPNFIGTIQSFVDQFLAMPWFSYKYKTKPIRIDNDIYYEQHSIPTGARAYLRNRPDAEEILFNSRLFGSDELKYYSEERQFPLQNKNSTTYQSLLELKKKIQSKGILCYEDAYILASEYINSIKRIKTIMQARFRLIFVDEMQDMDKKQHDILEMLFYDNGNSSCIFQRVGDKNQSIYNGEVSLDDIWSTREQVLEINGSYRLTHRNAQLVKCFGIDPLEIEGRRRNDDGSAIDIKPHIIKFDDNSIQRVIPKFAEIIRRLKDSNIIPSDNDNLYYAIAWRKENPEFGKISLKSYYNNFTDLQYNTNIDYSSLNDYIYYCIKDKNMLKPITNNIINAILKIMRMENIVDQENRPYNHNRLVGYIRQNHQEFYKLFKLNLYLWSVGILREMQHEVLDNIREFLPSFLILFGKEITSSRDFIGNNIQNQLQPVNALTENINCYYDNINDLKINIGTIHSVKGHTHTATLYLESNYHQQRDGTAYESQRLVMQFKGEQFVDERKYHKQSARMMYVGLSRPTHLICFAVHTERFQQCFTDINLNQYEVVEV